MSSVHVSDHAIDRYLERVARVTRAEAVDALSTPNIKAAASFRARYVKLPTGHKAVLDGTTVTTVLPADAKPQFYARRATNG